MIDKPIPKEARDAAEAMEREGAEVGRLVFQERNAFEDFLGHMTDGERRDATPEEEEKMDLRLKEVGELFKDSGVSWQLDGALNISLARGGYIGLHKDVDVSIEASEVGKLEPHLEKMGYGLFLSKMVDGDDPEGKLGMERVDTARFLEALERDSLDGHPMLAAVDDTGLIREDKELNFVDVHVVRREDGAPIGGGGVRLPEKWFEPIVHEHQGTELLLSHPAKVAYFKLRETRPYDESDLVLLVETGKVTEEDWKDIETAIQSEVDRSQESARSVVEHVVSSISNDASVDDVFEALVSHPIIEARMQSSNIRGDVEKIAAAISEIPEKSVESVLDVVNKLSGAMQYYQDMINRMERVKNSAGG